MEADDPAVLDDAVDDGGGHAPVAEHVGLSAEFEVGGKVQAAFLVAVDYDLEEQAASFDVKEQVAEFVDDDQFSYMPDDKEGSRLLFPIISECYETRSNIYTTNIESGGWGRILGNANMAAAIDRIVQHGRIVRFHGKSYGSQHALMAK